MKPVKEVKKGETFVGPGEHWTAIEDAKVERNAPGFDVVEIMVKYQDGGIGKRTWSDPEHEIPVVVIS